MHFQHPLYFFLLLALGVFLWLEWRVEAWRRKSAGSFADPAFLAWLLPPSSTRWRRLRLGVWLLALAALMAGLARPQGEPVARERPIASLTLLAVLDCSLSMNVQDITPSRFEAGQAAVLAMLDGLPEARIGLIGFASSARILCPATSDHEAVRLSLSQAAAGGMEPAGSDPGGAIQLALAKLQPVAGIKAVVLLTDGEANRLPDARSRMAQAAAEASRAGVPLYILGLGTAAGGKIPLGRDDGGRRVFRIHRGTAVVSRLEADGLREAARLARGGYWEHDRQATGALLAALGRRMVRDTSKRTVWERAEYYQIFTGLALALLLMEWLLPAASRRPQEAREGAAR